jgi:hypothetical protein
VDRPPSRLLLWLGLALVAAGWVVLYLGWRQAGEQELETGQLPFLLSGGFGAAGLLILGAVAIVVDAVQRAGWEARRASERTSEGIERLVRVLEATDDSDDAERPRRRRRRAGRAP